MRAAHPGFLSGHGIELLHQRGIKGAGQADGLRKTRAAHGRVAVQAFLVIHHRDAEPGVLNEEPLNRVRHLRRLARGFAASGVARAAHLAEAVPVTEVRLGLDRVKVPLAVEQQIRFLLPDAEHLRGFFLERHARKQVFHSGGGRKRSLLVSGNPRLAGAGFRRFLHLTQLGPTMASTPLSVEARRSISTTNCGRNREFSDPERPPAHLAREISNRFPVTS